MINPYVGQYHTKNVMLSDIFIYLTVLFYLITFAEKTRYYTLVMQSFIISSA